MTKFQVGNKIKVKRACSGAIPDETYTIGNGGSSLVALDEGQPTCSCQSNWILLKINIIKLNKEYVEYDKSPRKQPVPKEVTQKKIVEAAEAAEAAAEDASEATAEYFRQRSRGVLDITSVDDLRI